MVRQAPDEIKQLITIKNILEKEKKIIQKEDKIKKIKEFKEKNVKKPQN